MKLVARSSSYALAIGLAAFVAHASTYVVSVTPGPGVDFTSIQAAVDAAAPNDTLLVRPGQYSSFTLTKPLTVLGQPPSHVMVSGSSLVTGLHLGETAILADLSFNELNFPSLQITNCNGVVECDTIVAADGMDVSGCSDVRVRRLTGYGFARSLLVASSRVELTDSTLVGGSGFNLTCAMFGTAGSGRPPVEVASGELHVARCTLVGGNGGNATCPDPGLCGADGGNGGPGLLVGAGARALVSGLASNMIRGGSGGATDCGFRGMAGPGIRIGAGAELRHSGATITGIDNLGGTLFSPAIFDPTVVMQETPHPGSNLTIRVAAEPGSVVRVRFGRQALIGDVPGPEEDFLTTNARTVTLGTVPMTGVIGFNVGLSSSIGKGTFYFAQALVTLPDLSTARSNSFPVVVR